MTTASQTMIGRVIEQGRDRVGVVLMVIGATVLVASIAGKALLHPRVLQDADHRGIEAQ